MTELPADENRIAKEECRLLQELRATPGLLEQISQSSGSELALQSALRRQYPDDLVRMAVSLHQFRLKARGKFSRAEQMWFDRQGLEQSTAEVVSRYKAQRFKGTVWDLCSGIGSDSMSLAAHCDVIAVDIHAPNCLRTMWNAEVYGVADRVETQCRDVRELTSFSHLVHVDPDRRPGSSGRVSRIEDYVPGLDYLNAIMPRCPGGAIKVSPASNFGGKFPDAEIELISLHGECKEATVWFGELASDALFRATVLPAGESISGHPLEVLVPVSPLGQYLYDPDPSVVRAGLVDVLADRLGLSRLDRAEEYLTSDHLVTSPFLQPFEVLENLPNNEKELKAWLRKASVGPLEIKCRHIPIQADVLRRRLPLNGSEPRVIVFARLDGKARIVAARRISSEHQ
ncbi:class I SAM-dependent methyltransferase [Schlesneria sp. T3-172]|uniref:class I SAM-dependent methyltransferase n=1 Tax=Schlesneria sphaerica TaxID=3373610 RepID=UPI0037C6424A